MPAQEREAFIEQIELNQGILHKVCGMFHDNIQDKEDLYQEVIIQLWKSWNKFKGNSKLSTWMYRVALNTAISMSANSKKQTKARSLSPNDLEYSDETNPDVSNEEINALYRAISTLSKIEKAVILLYLEEKTYEEIAEITGLSKSNVGVKILRIKKKLEVTMQIIQAQ
ncbi:MAG: sigma-70 family RNA polymerase sigma factor [Bacteroidota bacterium]|nr:sigma-70 family RNA polymerase sigma factor [Bacteroidota bacterium]